MDPCHFSVIKLFHAFYIACSELVIYHSPFHEFNILPGFLARPSVVRPSSVRRPHALIIFSSETTEPIKVKFHVELLWDGGTMTAMLIYGKSFKKSSPEPKGR